MFTVRESRLLVAFFFQVFFVVARVPFFFYSDRIFMTLEEIKADQKNLKKMMLEIKQQRTSDVTVEETFLQTFPLKKLDDINELERRLLDPTVTTSLVSFSSLLSLNTM